MPNGKVYKCGCPNCIEESEHPNKLLHHQLNLLLSRMNEQERRWLVALESKRHGHGGIRFMGTVTGMALETIRRGRAELEADLEDRPAGRVRLPGGGRPPVEKKIRPSKAT